MKWLLGITVCCVSCLAVGAISNPSYFRSLVIGGGINDPVDGGAQIEDNGNMSIRGPLSDEMATYGDFETDSGYVSIGTPPTQERSSEKKRGGTYARKVVTDALGEGFYTTIGNAYGQINKQYRMSAWVYIDTASAQVTMSASGTAPYASETITAVGLWKQVNVSFIPAPEDVINSGIYVKFYSAGTVDAITFYVDDLSFKEYTGTLSVAGDGLFGGSIYGNTIYSNASLVTGTLGTINGNITLYPGTTGSEIFFHNSATNPLNYLKNKSIFCDMDTGELLFINSPQTFQTTMVSMSKDTTQIINALATSTIKTFTLHDTTPSVAGANIFQIPAMWDGDHDITAFDDGTIGQTIMILSAGGDCGIASGFNIRLTTAGWLEGTYQNSHIRLLCIDEESGGVWQEIGRFEAFL